MMIWLYRLDHPDDPPELVDWLPAWRLPVAGDILLLKGVPYEVTLVGFDPANALAAVTIRPEKP